MKLGQASQWGGRLVTVTVCLRTDGDFDSDELNMEKEEDDFDDEHDGRRRKKMDEKKGKRKMIMRKTNIKMPRWKNSRKNT
ncbi:protein AATF-like [Pyrus ussuriensis x Pyrus communis]|uniref:Protein AATF-like n=1 Tax=Pyrus ussuriensis x Pyrus communis TaxID=2448454 RepID=A0A5N5HHB1_9ROSA|nr:protein AATF-like [Pyrus ussuriensis x Pyrus communis]